jgi:hypothetical protein
LQHDLILTKCDGAKFRDCHAGPPWSHCLPFANQNFVGSGETHVFIRIREECD